MKYLLAIIITILTISGCGYQTMNNFEYIIVADIGNSLYNSKKDKNVCYYIGMGSTVSGVSEIFSDNSFCFYDTCGKFQIGDTINFVKK